LGDHVTVYRDAGGECYTTPVSETELEVALLVAHDRMRPFAGRLEAGAAIAAALLQHPSAEPLIEAASRLDVGSNVFHPSGVFTSTQAWA